MQISPEQLEKFKEVYATVFGVNLSTENAMDKAMSVLRIVKAATMPLTVEDEKNVAEWRGKTYRKMIQEGSLHKLIANI